ncbi:glycosyltransferase [Rhodococcus sp. LW-XY12]|uniref:glycosyltransferase n=1 Tax=Rhodococcus sp. LW-XY12 TaxID=2856851 RepID=UPI001C562D7A|nr:glycosyltransferase [Rhodococcus sp. LW-XY12]QXU53007.1 glycosyltransferase [Rhodococcus sp. LW-XY12]
MKSVAIIGTRGYPSYYGGFETLVRELAPYLADRGWNVTVYGRSGAIKDSDPSKDTRVHSKLTPGIESKSLSTLSYGLTSAAHSAFKKPDVALIMNVANGYWLPILKARGIPTVVNVDGIEWEREKWGKAAKFAFRNGANLTARFADHLVYDSREIGRRWLEEFSRNGDFIPYGARVDDDLPLKDELIPGSYALAVARFVPENTIEEFLAAAKDVSVNHPVVIVGSSGYGGPIDEAARILSETNENIHWLGHISDDDRLHALWQNAGVYFHGHSVGGTNPALVQAMACGCAIVARDTPFNNEVLDDAAIFVKPRPDEISRALQKVLTNPAMRKDLGLRARERQLVDYTWDAVCKSYEEVISAAIR